MKKNYMPFSAKWQQVHKESVEMMKTKEENMISSASTSLSRNSFIWIMKTNQEVLRITEKPKNIGDTTIASPEELLFTL